MRPTNARVERESCGADSSDNIDEFNHSKNAVSARTNALNPDIANINARARSREIIDQTAHATGGARHCRGRPNPRRGSLHSGVSMTPVNSEIFGSSTRTTSTRGAAIA